MARRAFEHGTADCLYLRRLPAGDPLVGMPELRRRTAVLTMHRLQPQPPCRGSWLDWLLPVACALALLLWTCGCQSSITGGSAVKQKAVETSTDTLKGGESRKVDDAWWIRVWPDSVEVASRHALAASTQPSVSKTAVGPTEYLSTTQPSAWSNDGVAPRLGEGELGTLAAVGFDLLKKKNFPFAVPLGLLLIVAGVGFWWVLGQRVWAIVCWALAGLAFIWPVGIAILAVAVLAYLLYGNWQKLKQLVSGAQNALDEMTPAVREQAKGLMAEKQDETTQNIVKTVKAGL